MTVKFKTEKNGTINAERFEHGVSLGIFNSDTLLTLEETKEGKLQICIDEDTCDELGVEIKMMNTVDFNRPIED